MLPVDEVPPGVGRRGAVGFVRGEEKSVKGAPLQWPGGVKDLVFFFFPQHLQPVLGWWKMGTPTASICGLILSLVLTCQLVTVSKLSIHSFFSLLNSNTDGYMFQLPT